jgi:type IV secretory pathway VirD2 relaxase
VRVTYSSNGAPGQWRAHGRYIARESATEWEQGKGNGFGSDAAPISVARTLDNWQESGDERMFKLIISPEFGERMDLKGHTRALMAQMERDLGTTLEWVAVTHYNTSHPHVHIALRGVNNRGEALRLERDYIRVGIRRHAEQLCTAQLGYRTQFDVIEAQQREVEQHHYTSIDRLINRGQMEGENRTDEASYFTIAADSGDPMLHGSLKVQQYHMAARLRYLEQMGLAEAAGANTWRVRRDFGDVLRAMQHATDRQKTLAAHGALLSDDRLRLQVTRPMAVNELEGRVLVHGEEDVTGRTYVLIEGTDAKVHFIYHENGIDTARHQGLMRVNSFVRIHKSIWSGHVILMVDDLGDARKLLENKSYFRSKAQRLIRRGVLADDVPGWGGWLGHYQTALNTELKALEIERTAHNRERYTAGPHGRL